MFTTIIFALKEVVPTSNSNTVMSLCRLFEMLLTEPVKQNPKDRNIRTWIMVHEMVLLMILDDIVFIVWVGVSVYI